MVLEKTLEDPLDSKEIKPVNPKGSQHIGWTNAEAEAPIIFPPELTHWKKTPYADKDRRQEEQGITEYKMVGWHRRLKGHEFEQTSGDSKGKGSLECCSLWGCRVRHD